MCGIADKTRAIDVNRGFHASHCNNILNNSNEASLPFIFETLAALWYALMKSMSSKSEEIKL